MPPKSKTKSKSKKKSTKKKTSTQTITDQVIVRMYDVGFGDCFLVFIPTSDGVWKILFDCGSIARGSLAMDDVVARIVQDVTDPDNVPRINLIVATHRHADHVSGFANSLWKKVEVQEVWMPWTEDPIDPEARRIRDTQSSLALLLQQQFTKLMVASKKGETQFDPYNRIALNALSNESAMNTLHSGFLGNPRRRFLPRKNMTGNAITTKALPGVLIHVLGPSRDEEIIRDMDPPAGQSYLKLMASQMGGETTVPDPFSIEWCLKPEEYSSDLVLPANIREGLKKIGEGLEPQVAVALEKAVNGTSLMILLQIGKSYLLFPGDAQWGTWNRALKDFKDLLKKTNFYKIGHHGSHNATPVDFVEKILGKDFWAMVSTRHVKKWPRIPKKELLEALAKLTKKIARSDQPQESPKAVFDSSAGSSTDAFIPI
jgi:beta-lactamase superfamily II metal-dependent hydrolase